MTVSSALKLAGCAIALATMFAVAPASAGTCRGGERFCSDAISVDVWKLGWHIRAGDGAQRPLRFVCDINGVNCHYSRSYLINDDGNFRFDPSIGGDEEPQRP
jgi:hypothetical protein